MVTGVVDMIGIREVTTATLRDVWNVLGFAVWVSGFDT